MVRPAFSLILRGVDCSVQYCLVRFPDPCELGNLTKYWPTDKSKRTQRKRTLSTRGEREAISLWNVLARQWAVSTLNTNTKHWAQHWRPDTRYDTTLDTEQRWRHTEHQQLNLLNTKQAAQKNYVHKPQNTVWYGIEVHPGAVQSSGAQWDALRGL